MTTSNKCPEQPDYRGRKFSRTTATNICTKDTVLAIKYLLIVCCSFFQYILFPVLWLHFHSLIYIQAKAKLLPLLMEPECTCIDMNVEKKKNLNVRTNIQMNFIHPADYCVTYLSLVWMDQRGWFPRVPRRVASHIWNQLTGSETKTKRERR